MNEHVLIEGTKIEMRGQTYTLPTMGGKAYRLGNAFEKLSKIEDAMAQQKETGKIALNSEVIGYMYDLTTLALQRNYPELTVDDVEVGLDLNKIMECFPLLVSQNKEQTQKGMELLAKNAQEQSQKKAK